MTDFSQDSIEILSRLALEDQQKQKELGRDPGRLQTPKRLGSS